MSATNLTFGEIRFQCSKRWPGVDPDVLDSWINERYRRVLRRLPWTRLRVQAVLQTVAPYETGTVAVTEGSNALTLTSGTWTAAMEARVIRIASRNEYYQFTYLTPTTGTLDRGFEGSDDTAAEYKIWQNVYVMPSDLRLLRTMRLLDSPRDMDQISQEEMDEQAANRGAYGAPDRYAPHMDDLSTPPRRQVELYPIPDDVYAVPFWYVQDPTLFSGTQTGNFLAPWLLPDAIYSGVEADFSRHSKDSAGAQLAELNYERALSEMAGEEARRIGPRPIKMAAAYTRHNRHRWQR